MIVRQFDNLVPAPLAGDDHDVLFADVEGFCQGFADCFVGFAFYRRGGHCHDQCACVAATHGFLLGAWLDVDRESHRVSWL